MVEAIKMAARVATLAIIAAAIVLLINTAVNLLAGAVGIGAIATYLPKAISFINHWTGGVGGWLLSIAAILFTIEAATVVYQIGSMATKFALKISEG